MPRGIKKGVRRAGPQKQSTGPSRAPVMQPWWLRKYPKRVKKIARLEGRALDEYAKRRTRDKLPGVKGEEYSARWKLEVSGRGGGGTLCLMPPKEAERRYGDDGGSYAEAYAALKEAAGRLPERWARHLVHGVDIRGWPGVDEETGAAWWAAWRLRCVAAKMHMERKNATARKKSLDALGALSEEELMRQAREIWNEWRANPPDILGGEAQGLGGKPGGRRGGRPGKRAQASVGDRHKSTLLLRAATLQALHALRSEVAPSGADMRRISAVGPLNSPELWVVIHSFDYIQRTTRPRNFAAAWGGANGNTDARGREWRRMKSPGESACIQRIRMDTSLTTCQRIADVLPAWHRSGFANIRSMYLT